MPDVFTKAKRSEVMSKIRARGNKDTELAMVRYFRQAGITGWRRHFQIGKAESRKLKSPAATKDTKSTKAGVHRRGKEGKKGKHIEGERGRPKFRVRPDFVFPKLKVAVFVDGCFWHGCPKHCRLPQGNRAFWRRKLAGNRARDRLVTRTLRRQGWRVVRVWEHEMGKR